MPGQFSNDPPQKFCSSLDKKLIHVNGFKPENFHLYFVFVDLDNLMLLSKQLNGKKFSWQIQKDET